MYLRIMYIVQYDEGNDGTTEYDLICATKSLKRVFYTRYNVASRFIYP